MLWNSTNIYEIFDNFHNYETTSTIFSRQIYKIFSTRFKTFWKNFMLQINFIKNSKFQQFFIIFYDFELISGYFHRFFGQFQSLTGDFKKFTWFFNSFCSIWATLATVANKKIKNNKKYFLIKVFYNFNNFKNFNDFFLPLL